ncbi:UNVERIFIED_CONTAM: hypothetical protein GTU68_023243 [Idotea baltica]|nr:hypothetical protein [Idotea baltica]
MNALGQFRIPFVFILDFEEKKCRVYPINEVPETIKFNFRGQSNYSAPPPNNTPYRFVKNPISIDQYQKAFNQVLFELNYGNSFLLNLTFKTPINSDLSLNDIFFRSKAKYKLWIENHCVVFSPETFIKIEAGQIYSYPMKGTIAADQHSAAKVLLDDDKEKSEHFTIVDLIRNDLSMIASEVRVPHFRYLEKIDSGQQNLLQASSEIMGRLTPDYHDQLGNIIFKLLPAGSISGAPKAKTVDIIQIVEDGPRGYYTGIMGMYDGQDLDSAVMIRYIEKDGDQMYYRSGGGITHLSELHAEYQEMIDKVYLPF